MLREEFLLKVSTHILWFGVGLTHGSDVCTSSSQVMPFLSLAHQIILGIDFYIRESLCRGSKANILVTPVRRKELGTLHSITSEERYLEKEPTGTGN